MIGMYQHSRAEKYGEGIIVGKKKTKKKLDSSIFQALVLEKSCLSFDRGLHQTLSGDLP